MIREVTNIYKHYKIDMRKLDDVGEFFDQVLRQMSQDGKNPLLMSEILEEVSSTHKHIMEQERMIVDQFETYKSLLCKISVYEFLSQLVGGTGATRGINELMGNDEEGARSSTLNEGLLAAGTRIV